MLKKLAKNFWRWFMSEPVPKGNASDAKWYVWTVRAPYWQVEEVYNARFKGIREEDNLIVKFFHKRLFGTPWPKLTDEFVKKNDFSIFMLPDGTVKPLKYIEKNCNGKFPKYLIDSQNQVLGIVIQPALVISKYFNVLVDAKSALCDMGDFVKFKDLEYLKWTLKEVNRMLDDIGLEKLSGRYWIDTGFRGCLGIGIWQENKIYIRVHDSDCAQILLKMKK